MTRRPHRCTNQPEEEWLYPSGEGWLYQLAEVWYC